jgi:hypothetical protein
MFHDTCIGLPGPYAYTVDNRIFGDFPAINTAHTPDINGLANFTRAALT